MSKENGVIMENGMPKIVLSEQNAQIGHVPAEEAKRLAKLYARKIIYESTLKSRIVRPH